MPGCCELCGREVQGLTRHHLIPRARHTNKVNRKLFDRDEVRGRVALLCRPCHKQLHSIFEPKELEREYNTLERLATHPEVARFVAWVRKRPEGTSVPSYRSRARPRGGRDGPR